MPTPDAGDTAAMPVAGDAPRSSHTSCPPEQDAQLTHTESVGQHLITVPGPPSVTTTDTDGHASISSATASTARSSVSPVSISDRPKFEPSQFPSSSSPSFAGPFPPPLRSPGVLEPAPARQPMPQHTSSLFRNGSRFVGTQQSDRQVYNVSVDIKHVDMRESFVCGYLRIEGLTPDHPTLTTYFEGEIIGTKHTFQTRHAEWGVNEKVDMQHWNRFPAWRPLARQAKQANFSYKNYADREHLFMRWKEYFLVPDHRVTSISGASFDGFYYICFNQASGSVSGIYFHSKSEKSDRYQQLELKHVPDGGCKAAFEFA